MTDLASNDLVIDLRDTPTTSAGSRRRASTKCTARAAAAAHVLSSATIAELSSTEADLAFQAHLGDLHPAHARRLAAVSAELDRRWSNFA